MNKEEKREYMKKYWKKYYEDHKEKIKEQKKKWYETHKDEYNEKFKKKYESNKEYFKEKTKKYSKYSHYFRKKFSRFISLKNYLTIMKLGDDSLKRSIMTKLGQGTIDQDEAVALSGMTFTKEDLKEMNDWLYNVCRCKSAVS